MFTSESCKTISFDILVLYASYNLIFSYLETLKGTTVLELIEGYLGRFQDELDQINLKNSIGGMNKRNQHAARKVT